MEPQKPWFKSAFDEADRVVAAQKTRREEGIRFNLRFAKETNKGEEAKVVFCDPDTMQAVPGFWEHEYDMTDGSWWNHTLCPKPAACLMCERGVPVYFAGAFTVIRLSVVRDNAGHEYVNQRQLLIAKADSLQRLRRMFEIRNGLVGTVWSVSRTSFKSAKCGDDWQFMEKFEGGRQGIATRLGLAPDLVAPFDYTACLKVKSREELMAEPIDWGKSVEKFMPGGGGGQRGQQPQYQQPQQGQPMYQPPSQYQPPQGQPPQRTEVPYAPGPQVQGPRGPVDGQGFPAR